MAYAQGSCLKLIKKFDQEFRSGTSSETSGGNLIKKIDQKNGSPDDWAGILGRGNAPASKMLGFDGLRGRMCKNPIH
ncbi:hypothetical protein [Glutamicibacter protophormiae]|uniref:Uncharacterized protein n=1 Tax=Glutamicibacter protophormiae TaxID=37930 RepID=A0ABS4XR51_GLUPR|nr:hypothetical protein [Glutamicibacter protophormiae]MBP2398994.1 hypothetical protein [Glutamicibacter protophormiae]GGL95540.1 hypothetical protein GCM10010038_27140 [Glutamicibacter protophormiae]